MELLWNFPHSKISKMEAKMEAEMEAEMEALKISPLSPLE